MHVRDPHGVLSLVKKFSTKDDIFRLMVDAAFYFDVDAIKNHDLLASEVKEYLVTLGNRPRDLKHLIRMSIQTLLGTCLPSKVQRLPLPPLLKSYLVFNL